MDADFVIGFDEEGRLQMIYSDALIGLLSEGETELKRASHVEPAPGGGWTADMKLSNGPVLGPFVRHGEALAAEREWLYNNRI